MFQKFKEATKGAVASVDIGVKKSSYRAEIRDRRRLIRDLKGEWGCVLFDAMKKPNGDELLKSSFEVLDAAITEKMEEIHRFEEKYLTLHEVLRDSFEVHRKKEKEKGTIISTERKEFNCETCHKVIIEERITCGLHNFHVICFRCFSCKKDLASLQQVFMLDFNPYCDDCGEKYICNKIASIDGQELLQWVQNEVKGFNEVEIKDFEPMTWRNGLGFACLCAKYFPDLLRWSSVTDGIMNQTPLVVCRAGLEGLSRAGITMLFSDALELRECDKRSVMIQILLMRQFFIDKPTTAKAVDDWNLKLGKIPQKHFEKTDFRKEHESLDKTGTIKKEAEKIDQVQVLEQGQQT